MTSAEVTSAAQRTFAVRTLLALAALTAPALALSACASTESESARLQREGARLIAGAGTVGLGGANPQVHVGQVALVQGSGRTAAAVQLIDVGTDPQTEVPVLIDVRNRTGASLYRNDIEGLEPSLQQMPLLRPHTSTWWVDDQVLANGTPSAVKVRIGAPRAHTARALGGSATALAAGGVSVADTSLGSDLAGPYVAGTVVNRTGVAQHNMPIFAVALRGGRVVAAGRALVPNLAASSATRRGFRIYLVGSPASARVEIDPVPAAGT